ncbi:MAG: LysM peptidoglycan-binding domain-containing protein [Rhodoglobus sp.]
MTETAPPTPGSLAHSVFAGLTPTNRETLARRRRSAAKKAAFSTVPIILMGSLAAMTLNLTGPVEPANAKPKPLPADVSKSLRGAVAAAAPSNGTTSFARTAAPETYTVAAGDTVSEIAGRYGLSTASVLALNGLSWSSMIFPGQELKLTNAGTLPPVVVAEAKTTQSSRYTIVAGDTISSIAESFGISTSTVLTANGLSAESIIYPGQTLAIPDISGATPPSSESVDAELAVDVTPIDTAPPAPGSTYTIAVGDTISGIAARFGLSEQALLDSNGLTASSLIFSGESLIIPGAMVAAVSVTPLTGSLTKLNDEMRANAITIIEVGRELGVSDYGIVIALATAMQESSMRNLDWGDRDSVGLFQQRPSSGWGTPDDLTTPRHAAQLFYGGPSNPNAGRTQGLLDVDGWESLPLTVAAQRVQISAYPDAYAKWEVSARAWLAELG